MATLRVLKGPNQGTVIPLNQDNIILGRNPDCDVVISITSVSREHAQIIRGPDGFHVMDLKSRNGTFVNNQQINERTALKNNDRIRICDFLATFQDSELPPLPPELTISAEELEPDNDEAPNIESTLTSSKNLLLDSQPAEKVKALLDISGHLSKTLELDSLLPKIGDSLFHMFRQADRCFLILADENPLKLIPKMIKTRRVQDESTARFSRSIVKRCLERGEAFLCEDASAGVPLSQSVVDFRIRSVMCVPLTAVEGKTFGVIQLDSQDRNKKFTKDDLNLLWGVANQVSVALENARMHENLIEQTRVRQGMEMARQVQRSFLPQQLPQVPNYEFCAHYEPAQEVGGDYYDFIPLAGRGIAVVLGDVAGKGMPAALLMAKLSSDARFCLLTEPDPALAMHRLNDLIHPNTSQMDRFVTLASAFLDPEHHAVTVVNAGHPTPLLYQSKTGTLQEATGRECIGMPLGILDGQSYERPALSLEPGDCLLVFSDGVTDAVNVRREAFDVEGIYKAVQDGGPYTPSSLVDRVVKAVKQHSAGCSQHDDITLVCLGRIS